METQDGLVRTTSIVQPSSDRWRRQASADPHHRRLERGIDRLERRLPGSLSKALHRVRAPSDPRFRILTGGLLLLGGMFSFLPVLGLWMLPLGLLLLALDVPLLKPTVGWALVKGERRWRLWRRR